MKTKILACIFCCVGFNACTKPGATTGISTAAGATVGAGIGAIIGSQGSSTSGGMVIGAVLGSAAGAAVGNAVEYQNERFEAQNELILKQQQELKKNQKMLEDLKRIRKADGDVRAGLSPKINLTKKVEPVSETHKEEVKKGFSFAEPIKQVEKPTENKVQEKSLGVEEATIMPATESTTAKLPSAENAVISSDTTECKKAADEVSQAEQAVDLADRLFRYRRALRLCPQRADYHVKLGEVYQKLGREEDSQYEFKEALKLDPGNKSATALLQSTQDKKSARY